MAKRVSIDDKKKRILNLIQCRRTVFHLKELEKLAAKEKLVNANHVKGIIDGLVDETLLDADKFGASTFMWSFATKAVITQKRKLEESHSNKEHLSKKLKVIDERLKDRGASGDDTSKLAPVLEKIDDLKIQRDELSSRLEIAMHNNPRILKHVQENIEKVKLAANRWTDNVFQIRTWCRNKMSIESSVFDSHFKIPDDFDYL